MPRTARLNITAQQQNGRAEIVIDGDIFGYNAGAATFRQQVRDLVAGGVRDAHVYLNTRGGNIFLANEIINVIKSFPGRMTGEGGALVASAGTNIMLYLEDFAMPSNGMVMIHKGMGEVEGNEDEIASYLDLLKKLTQQYRAAYAKAMGIEEDEVEKLWNKGNKWFTAQEALEAGLIKRITDDVQLDEEAVAEIAACGAPKDKLPTASAGATKPETMDIKALRALYGMPENATEEQVLAKAREMKESNDRHTAAAAQLRINEVKGLIDAAIKDRKITEAHRASYDAKFAADFGATKAELEGLVAAPTMAKETNAGGGADAGQAATAAGREAWKYKDWAEKDMKGLKALMENEPDKFKALYAAHYGVEPVIPTKA